MSLAEIEKAVDALSPKELAQLAANMKRCSKRSMPKSTPAISSR
jgi:hypothetical protein